MSIFEEYGAFKMAKVCELIIIYSYWAHFVFNLFMPNELFYLMFWQIHVQVKGCLISLTIQIKVC